MKCPYCGFTESKVIDSRPTEGGDRIRRRRQCESCDKRFTTYEIVESMPIVVVKRDGNRQTFDRSKVITGLLRACQKRPVTLEQIENIADEVTNELRSSMDREVSSQTIGNLIMDRLRNLDEVSYVRFASVYRSFKDVPSFMEELNRLLETNSAVGKTAALGDTADKND